jgi:hypothetical protein
MRFYHDYDNRRGKNYGAGMKAGCEAHTRGWHAGVRVCIGEDDKGRDRVAVWMTGGSSGHHPGTFLGTVTDTPDGPHWAPAASAAPSRSARAAAARRELDGLRSEISSARRELDAVPADARRELADVMEHIRLRRRELDALPPRSKDEDHPGIARHALQLAIDTLLAMDCTFSMCPGHAVPFQDMLTCSRCAAIQDLRAELGRLDKVIITQPTGTNDMEAS